MYRENQKTVEFKPFILEIFISCRFSKIISLVSKVKHRFRFKNTSRTDRYYQYITYRQILPIHHVQTDITNINITYRQILPIHHVQTDITNTNITYRQILPIQTSRTDRYYQYKHHVQTDITNTNITYRQILPI